MKPLTFTDWREWTRIAGSCLDAEVIPRHPQAGEFVTENGLELQIMHNGVKVLRNGYNNGHLAPLFWLMRGVNEPQEERCFYECLKAVAPGGTIIELGANWAFYSLWFYKSVENANCHCIELDTALLELGIKHFEINSGKAIFTNAAVGMPDLSPWHTTLVGQYIRALPSGKIFWDRPANIPGFHRNIPIITVDGYIEANEISCVDILHSDIQGEELRMLKGAENSLLSKKIGFLFISTHSEELHSSCLDHLKSKDYRIIAEHTLADSFSADGLIVARSPAYPGPDAIPITRRTSPHYI